MADPIGKLEFAAVLQRLGPFEKNPTIAVGISGGRDSTALLLLAAEWARANAGHVVALTVDHGIRETSVLEAKQVAAVAGKLGVEHEILRWEDPHATAPALQQRARAARYDLLTKATVARGILHLLIAHHEDDQAETVLLRLAKGSGPDGLAGMSAIVHQTQLRILRPLLGIARDRLTATCEARGAGWSDDPSNKSPSFARPRLRAAGNALAVEGLTPHTLALTANASAKARASLEWATAAVLARHGRILPQGYAELTLAGWDSVDPELKRRALAQLLQTIGGGDYPPNADAVEEILQIHLSHPLPLGRGNYMRTTLAGCLMEHAKDRLLILRENRNIQPSQLVDIGILKKWERFEVSADTPCMVDALGENHPDGLTSNLPRAVLATQPAFRQDGMLLAVPTLEYFANPALRGRFRARFAPKRAAGSADFTPI